MFIERYYWSPILHAPFAGPARATIVCLARREWKKLEIFQVHLFFGHGARMVIRHIGRKINLIPIFFTALVNIVALFFEPSFFSSLLHVAVRRFLVLHFYGMVCKCIQNRFDQAWLYFGRLSEYASFCRRHVCMDWNLQELLIRVPLLATWNLSDIWFQRYSSLFFKRDPNFYLLGLLKSVEEIHHCNLTLLHLFLRILDFLHTKITQLFDFFWKTNFQFSCLFFFNVNCLLMFYTVKRKNCLINDTNGAQYCTPFCSPRSCKGCLSGPQRIEKTWDLSGAYIFWTWCWNGNQT